jgi:excisionase family DNA binding protein
VKQVVHPEVDAVSVADAAKLLFVSRLHVVKLLEQGKLKLHHKSGNDRFITKSSLLAYQAQQRAAARAYQTSAGENE